MPIMDPIRRKILAAGAAAMAASPRVFGQQTGQGGAMSFYEKGPVRIHYEEAGSGFPLLLIAGGGLNSTISGLHRGDPFNPIEEFKREYRCIAADLRNANDGQSSGPLEIDRPWDAYTDDHLGLMDHLGIGKFMVMRFCIGGAAVRRQDRGGDPRAERRVEHVPVEGAEGADSAGGAPDTFIPAGAAPCFCVAGRGRSTDCACAPNAASISSSRRSEGGPPY